MSASDPFPGFSKLYSFASDGSSRVFIADVELEAADPAAVTRGVTACAGMRARWAMGRPAPDDIVWTSLVPISLLSERVVAALREHGISGWSTYPVQLIGKQGEPLPTYFGLVVRGRCAAIDRSRSRQAMKQFPAGPRPVTVGLEFDERSWDGSDIFMPEDRTAWIFMTERAKKLLSVFRTVEFTALDEVELRVV